MKTFLAALGVLVLSATLAGCTGETEPAPETPKPDANVVTEASSAFVDTTENIFNHGMSTEELEIINTDMVEAMGDTGVDYEAVWGVLSDRLDLAGVWVPVDADPATKAGVGFRVFNFYNMNSIGDVITVKVNPDTLTFNEDFTEAYVPRDEVKVTSEMNDTTQFGDFLTSEFDRGEQVVLHYVDGEWLMDVSTLGVGESVETAPADEEPQP